MRAYSHGLTSTSGRDVVVCRCKTRRLQVHAALLEPPPFEPRKLSVQYLAGARPANSLSMPMSRRYTLTHNDLTGALNLSIGLEYNVRQIQGFYTRILRDEITAEWYFNSGASAPAELHIYCHVSGEEKWLAPPQLRNFIFRREMTLVLDTFYYADKEFLRAHPGLLTAKVYVHFQSDLQDLDVREYWGTLGDRRSWRRMPKGVLARLKLLLFGFPAAPHQRPRSSLTCQQQQRQQQQQQLVPAAVAAAATTSDAIVQQQQQQQQQWHPVVESVVCQTRPVAFSLQEQRRMQQGAAQQQTQKQGLDQQQLAGSLLEEGSSSNAFSDFESVLCTSSQSSSNSAGRQPQPQVVVGALRVPTPVGSSSFQASSSDDGASSQCCNSESGSHSVSPATAAGGDKDAAPVPVSSNRKSSNSWNGGSNHNEASCEANYVAAEQQVQQQAMQQRSWLVAAVAVSEQTVQQQPSDLGMEQDVLNQQSCKYRSTSRNGLPGDHSSSTAPAKELNAPVTTFQLVLQQPQVRVLRSAVVAAAGSHTGVAARSAKHGM